jgi:hypothetical protein
VGELLTAVDGWAMLQKVFNWAAEDLTEAVDRLKAGKVSRPRAKGFQRGSGESGPLRELVIVDPLSCS